MPARPLPTLLATILLLVIGLSGLAVGVQLLVALSSPAAASMPEAASGVPLFGGIAVYGAVTAVAGIGMYLLRRWGWWLGVLAIVAGLAVLVAILVATGPDPVILGGVLIWAVTLGLLLVPLTRRAVSR